MPASEAADDNLAPGFHQCLRGVTWAERALDPGSAPRQGMSPALVVTLGTPFELSDPLL